MCRTQTLHGHTNENSTLEQTSRAEVDVQKKWGWTPAPCLEGHILSHWIKGLQNSSLIVQGLLYPRDRGVKLLQKEDE